MVSDRPYSAAVTEEEAMAELERCAGSQFDPMAVEAFRTALEQHPVAAPSGEEPKPIV